MAAGKGSRLEGLTGGAPKSFVEIKGKKLIEYNIKLLEKYGIKDIIIVTGYCCEVFEEFLKDKKQIRLIYNPFYEMVNVLGSFYMGMEALHDDFIFLHADVRFRVVVRGGGIGYFYKIQEEEVDEEEEE